MPARRIDLATVDFEAVRRCHDLKFFVAAAHLRSGREHIWRGAEVGFCQGNLSKKSVEEIRSLPILRKQAADARWAASGAGSAAGSGAG